MTEPTALPEQIQKAVHWFQVAVYDAAKWTGNSEEAEHLADDIARARAALERAIHEALAEARAALAQEGETPQQVTRVEVIDHRANAENGRALVVWDDTMAVELSYQDQGRTLKVFLDTRSNQAGDPEQRLGTDNGSTRGRGAIRVEKRTAEENVSHVQESDNRQSPCRPSGDDHIASPALALGETERLAQALKGMRADFVEPFLIQHNRLPNDEDVAAWLIAHGVHLSTTRRES